MGIRERIVLLIFTLFNIVSNGFIPFYSDETYYWMWSKKLALSYFDHPPMVAYLIKATTLFGDSVMEIRLGAPLMMAGAAYLLYKLAHKMFDEKIAIYTFYIFLSGIIVQGGYTLITPDIPLIFFWTLTLYTAYIYIEEDQKIYALLTGISAGALLLSKYTGVLLLISILLYILIYKRTLFKDRYFYYALVLCFAVFSPVIYWNYLHDFISFKFQLGHGIAEEKLFSPNDLLKFAGAQILLFHPLYLFPLLYFIVKDRERLSRKRLYLLIPFLFPLGFFIYFSAFKHANAQWAAPAYLSATILLGLYLAQRDAKRLIQYAVAVTALLVLLVKTPIGDIIPIVDNFKSRAGKIDNFDREIKALNLDIDSYDYILIDDYHGTDVAYYFGKIDNILVLSVARFSNFNIWRYEDLGISMESPLYTIPKLGKSIYIGISDLHVFELNQIFGEPDSIRTMEKRVGKKMLKYYFVEYHN
ncbi:MAG: glycosyltransferase family 39 protein [Campylobacterota bacterium]|nr:glycosyltransferase family 39 protein [Campylobacterota bacterium]